VPAEYQQFATIKPSAKPYVMMEWVLQIVLNGNAAGAFRNKNDTTLSFHISSAIQRLRAHYATLGDSLKDGILPF
jgi:hypothetical protein